MKAFLKYGLIVLLLGLVSFVTEDNVVKAIKNGSASQLSKYFSNTIKITLINKSNTYSKKQAVLVLKDFFENNIVKGFQVVHRGDNVNDQFIIGILETKNGEYRTTIYIRKKGNNKLLQELRFEK